MSQEVAGADAGDEGRVPRTVDVELREDLVDCCAAGEVVTVVGLVRVLDTAADPGHNRPDSLATGVICLLWKEMMSQRRSLDCLHVVRHQEPISTWHRCKYI